MRLPESWVETKLGRVVDDLQPGFAQKPGEEDDGTTPQIRTHNITPSGKITLEGIKHVSASYKELERYVLTAGDVVFNNTNSEEWVGKTAVFDQEGEFVFSNHMTRLRVHRDLVNPEYLAAYLHFLWSMGYPKTRAKRWVSQAGIDSSTLASFKIPLPTLPEQQRIVDVLRQVDAVIQEQRSRRQKLDLMINAALDRLVFTVDDVEWEPLGALVETRYGTSVSADATADSGTAVLRIPNVMGGEVDTADIKYVELPQAELARLRLTDSDVLIVRSNGNPDYVGRSAPITEDIACSSMVYASYLIRLRTDAKRLLPEYLSAFLNSSFGRAAMRNAIRTTAGQSNLSAENLTKVRLPVPSLTEQQRFRSFWLEVKALRKRLNGSEHTAEELRSVLCIDAISGNLTENWRHQNQDEIAETAITRDALLRELGTKIIKTVAEPVPCIENVFDTQYPARQRLMNELSMFQRSVLAAFLNYEKYPLYTEDPEEFADFCTDESLVRALEGHSYSSNTVGRTISLLADLGLIAQISLPRINRLTQEREFLKAFRPLRATEFTRSQDLKSIRNILKVTIEKKMHYYFYVQLDYETPERAGAGGMFQVVSVEDQDNKDFTHLVDQGDYYSSLDELKIDIAKVLNVSVEQVELEEM